MSSSFSVWRGVGFRGRTKGLSWSLARDKAVWFARRAPAAVRAAREQRSGPARPSPEGRRAGQCSQANHPPAAELVALAPDVILAPIAAVVVALRRATRAVPIVFVQVTDPVGAGLVESLARPGGNATGFMNYEYGLSGKWLELLKQIAPRVTRAAVIRDPTEATGIGQFAAIQSMAPSLGVVISTVNMHDAAEIERAVVAFARKPNGGLIVPGATLATLNRELIITLAARHRLPAVYSNSIFVTGGGLIAYGPDRVDQYRRAAGYVDRILKGEKPAPSTSWPST